MKEFVKAATTALT